ncbi:TPA: glycosyltransferase [Vibrio cholerae]|uniref:glycosyltransferase family 2 protein n=1 Tax=Vibrio cholerae TaxID=666 RepID=UPI001F379398|nr:glycosyltransferase [Vibrio cholerae]UIP03940.1 glycosyltransferase [Vibrio cholerae]HEQ3434729.1 glycosyltransferase [Vibrio cholerae]HEQ3495608.1 glycosyltransferase [Vibrio cholerae]HEQ3507363.1 glycosyltransferase [Vibrio cholerae]HEQ3571200.1 glycosyltransferase [Vibrio cholerae]
MNISVVITTKDRPEFLDRAIGSIIKNYCNPLDIVVVNDGGKQIKNFDISLPCNVKIINNKESLGGNKARNQGVLASEGDIIFFLDDDDAYTLETISDKLNIFSKYPNVGLVYTGVKFVTSDALDVIKREKKPSENASFLNLLKYGNIIGPTSSVAVRKSKFFEAGMFDEDLSAMQDYELWIRMARCSEVMHDNGMNLIYTIHTTGEQISSKHEKYLCAAEYIFNKFSKDIEALNAHHHFWSEVYFRVALSASHSSEFKKIRYASKSFLLRPSIKSLALLLPTFALRKIKPFV